MNERTMHVRVGAAIVIAVGIFIWSVLWVEDIQWQRKTAEIQVIFNEVGSLTRGDVVSVSGLERGSVKNLALTEGGVLATLELDRDVVLKRDATVRIRTVGVMGERFVFIDPGKSLHPYDLSAPLRGSYEPGMSEVFGSIGSALSSLQLLVERVDALVKAVEQGGGLAESVDNMRAFSNDLKALTRRSAEDLEVAIRDIRYGSSHFREVLETKGPQMAQTLSRFDSTSVRLANAIAQFDSLSVTLNALATKLEEGEGSLGMLLQDKELYLELRQAAKNANLLIEDIKQNPNKYFKVELF